MFIMIELHSNCFYTMHLHFCLWELLIMPTVLILYTHQWHLMVDLFPLKVHVCKYMEKKPSDLLCFNITSMSTSDGKMLVW